MEAILVSSSGGGGAGGSVGGGGVVVASHWTSRSFAGVSVPLVCFASHCSCCHVYVLNVSVGVLWMNVSTSFCVTAPPPHLQQSDWTTKGHLVRLKLKTDRAALLTATETSGVRKTGRVPGVTLRGCVQDPVSPGDVEQGSYICWSFGQLVTSGLWFGSVDSLVQFCPFKK